MPNTPPDKQREMADTIWRKIKGKPLPDSYDDREAAHIISRYWHRAMESEQDEDLSNKNS